MMLRGWCGSNSVNLSAVDCSQGVGRNKKHSAASTYYAYDLMIVNSGNGNRRARSIRSVQNERKLLENSDIRANDRKLQTDEAAELLSRRWQLVIRGE